MIEDKTTANEPSNNDEREPKAELIEQSTMIEKLVSKTPHTFDVKARAAEASLEQAESEKVCKPYGELVALVAQTSLPYCEESAMQVPSL